LFSYFVGEDDVSGIGVREWGEGSLLVELRGEFDQYNLDDLQDTLSGVVALRRPTLVDLSAVTFLDIGATRELTIRSRLYAHHLALCNPSWQVRASVSACGFEALLDFTFGTDDPASGCPELSPTRKGPPSTV
jgi:anti-anti-sigma factor